MARRSLLREPGQVAPRPGRGDEVRLGKDLFRVLPVQDLEHGVGARDEEQVDVTFGLLAQFLKRVDRVGGPLPVDLHPGDREPRVARGRDHRHEIAVLRRGHLPLLLHPGSARRDEHHFIQVELPQGGLGGHQMPVMDRVERSAHDPDAPRIRHRQPAPPRSAWTHSWNRGRCSA